MHTLVYAKKSELHSVLSTVRGKWKSCGNIFTRYRRLCVIGRSHCAIAGSLVRATIDRKRWNKHASLMLMWSTLHVAAVLCEPQRSIAECSVDAESNDRSCNCAARSTDSANPSIVRNIINHRNVGDWQQKPCAWLVSVEWRAVPAVIRFTPVTYIFALSYAQIPSLHSRRENANKRFLGLSLTLPLAFFPCYLHKEIALLLLWHWTNWECAETLHEEIERT